MWPLYDFQCSFRSSHLTVDPLIVSDITTMASNVPDFQYRILSFKPPGRLYIFLILGWVSIGEGR